MLKVRYQLLNIKRKPPSSARYALQSLGHVSMLLSPVLSSQIESATGGLSHSLVESISSVKLEQILRYMGGTSVAFVSTGIQSEHQLEPLDTWRFIDMKSSKRQWKPSYLNQMAFVMTGGRYTAALAGPLPLLLLPSTHGWNVQQICIHHACLYLVLCLRAPSGSCTQTLASHMWAEWCKRSPYLLGPNQVSCPFQYIALIDIHEHRRMWIWRDVRTEKTIRN